MFSKQNFGFVVNAVARCLYVQGDCSLGTSHPSIHILLFESSWLERLRGSAVIRRADARVLPAARIDQALHHVSKTRVDIALLDMDSSQGRPDDILRVLHDKTPDAYVVAMSSTAADLDLEACFARGFDDFVPKPLHVERLRIVMDAAVDAQRVNRITRTMPIVNEDDFYSPELHSQLLVHLREETDRLYAMLSTSPLLSSQLDRRMHRIRSGLLLLGLRSLADECRDLERDCELPGMDDGVLRRRGWRIARQMRAISASGAVTSP